LFCFGLEGVIRLSHPSGWQSEGWLFLLSQVSRENTIRWELWEQTRLNTKTVQPHHTTTTSTQRALNQMQTYTYLRFEAHIVAHFPFFFFFFTFLIASLRSAPGVQGSDGRA
jgi:hypothetical protein